MSVSLHACGYRDPLTGERACDQPARLYQLPSPPPSEDIGEYDDMSVAWICDGHAFAIEDLLERAR